MKRIKALWYGMFIDYHLNKTEKIDVAHTTVFKYHHEMSLHYFKKAYGREFDRESDF